MRYRKLVTLLKDRREKGAVVGILPRFDINGELVSRILGINNRVKNMCTELGVVYIDLYHYFENEKFRWYKEDGLHLNSVGSQRYAELLHHELSKLGF